MSSSRRSALSPRRFGLRDGALLAEALATLAFASLAIRLTPFRKLVEWSSRPPSRPGSAGTVDIVRLRRAVEAWARRVPWRAVCFQSGLALQIMLRRRGIRSVMHYGLAQHDSLKAHVWLTVGGEPVIGGEQAAGFVEVATFPAA